MSADEVVDVLVAGGGPAGWATAIYAVQAGMSVQLVEPRPGAVDKACGEGLLPAAVAALSRIGVDPTGTPLTGLRYLTADGSRQAEARFRGGAGRGVRRLTLSAALLARGEELGVRREQGTVLSTEAREGGTVTDLRVGERTSRVRSRWLVGADGLHSPLRRSLGLDVRSGARSRYGLRRHFRLAAGRSTGSSVSVYWGHSAEVYLTPLPDGVLNVAVLGGGGRSYAEVLAGFPPVRELLEGAEVLGPVRGAGALRQRSSTCRSGAVLLVGDAAGYVDALTGEGVRTAVEGAETLVDCLLRNRPGEYPRALARRTRRTRLLTAGLLLSTSRPSLRRRLVPVAAAAPGLFGATVAALG